MLPRFELMQFQTKSEVRQHVLSQKPAALPLAGVLKNLSQFLGNQKGAWGAFKALSEEPAIEGCLSNSISWYFPRIQNQHLEFVKAKDANPASWKRSSLGFQEPTDGEVTTAQKLNGFLVPGLAFSKKGERIGRGKGFYDKTLSDVSGLKVGVCYSYQLFAELPTEPHDVRMDVVVSDLGITWLKR
jgi:5-formyltetrahydrofolate cyclo-ligase